MQFKKCIYNLETGTNNIIEHVTFIDSTYIQMNTSEDINNDYT